MKILIADISWVIGCRRGLINAQRDTFLRDVPKFPGLDYKVFVGDGTPTGVDETDVLKSFSHAPKGTHVLNANNQPKMPFDYIPETDEVVLHAPDDLAHLAYKAQATWRWAFDKGYDYAFACFCDTYMDIPRLMASGFEKHPFTGMTYDENRCPQGGCGYWLNRKCLEILANERVTFWADDGWAGWTLQKHGIWLNNDQRYNYYPLIPTKETAAISVHVSEHVLAPVSVYDMMQSIYKGMQP